ncbi:tetratricopeptide repeat protein [Nocardia asteroides]|uniref:tetratricopeptide repeat protein n=1 Tax=Nocardia asteroides TaxID=1824 RepID=UPI0034277C42
MTDMGDLLGRIRCMPMDSKNTGPKTESYVEYEKHVVALWLVRELASDSSVCGVVMQHSSDVILLFRDRRPKLVSVKHREPSRSKSDAAWGPTQLGDADVLAVLYRQWVDTEEFCQPAFWSNAGVTGTAYASLVSMRTTGQPDQAFVDWFARRAKVPVPDALRFVTDLELLSDPFPRHTEIVASGAAATAKFLDSRKRSVANLFADECFDALSRRLIELSKAEPVAPEDDTRLELVREILPGLTARDAQALATRLLPASEAAAILLGEHDRKLAGKLPEVGYWWDADSRFVGRSEILDDLARRLEIGGIDPVAPVVIRGLTGCGKTSVATQLAAIHSDRMQPVFIDGTSRADVVAALQKLSAAAQPRDLSGIAEARTPVTPALPATSRTLLVLDGVLDPEAVRGLIPRRSLCRVLITTTLANLDIGYNEVELASWQPAESCDFLGAYLPEEPAEDLDRLRAELVDHPLALTQAVDHCIITGRPLSEYIVRLQEAPLATLELGKAAGHPASVIEAIRLNIELAQQTEPISTTLLNLLAFLGPSTINETLFDSWTWVANVNDPDKPATPNKKTWWSWRRRSSRSQPDQGAGGETISDAVREIMTTLRDKEIRDRTVHALARVSLVKAHRGRLTVHPLIAKVVRHQISDPVPWLEAGLGLFLPPRPDWSITEPAPAIDQHLGSAAHITSIAYGHGLTGPATFVVTSVLAHRLALVGPNESAAPNGWTAIDFGQRGVEAAERHLQVTGNPQWLVGVAKLQLSLAHAYSLAGRVDDAFADIEASMAIGRELGLPDIVAEAFSAMEQIASMHGRRDKAEAVIHQIESGNWADENLSVDFHVMLLATHANLLRMLARVSESRAVIDSATSIIDDLDYKVSPIIAYKTYAAASVIAKDQGNVLDALNAEMSLVRLMESSEDALHVSPGERIQLLERVADAAVGANRLAMAVELVDQAGNLISEHRFSSDSMLYIDWVSIRGRIYLHQGKLKEAREDLEHAITHLRRLPGSYKPRLPAPLVHLGRVLHEQGDTAAAIELVEDAYRIDCEIYGPDHPEAREDWIMLQAIKGTLKENVSVDELLRYAGLGIEGGAASSTENGRILVDTRQVIQNIEYGLRRIGTKPHAEWGVADFISEEEIEAVFFHLPFGTLIITATLRIVKDLLVEILGPQYVPKPLSDSYDFNKVSGSSLMYTPTVHQLAVQLFNAAVAEGFDEIEIARLLADRDDSEELVNSWFIIVVTYQIYCAYP